VAINQLKQMKFNGVVLRSTQSGAGGQQGENGGVKGYEHYKGHIC
jgi:hypothetical protein